MNDVWGICRMTKNSTLHVLSNIGTQGPTWNTWAKLSSSNIGFCVSVKIFTDKNDAESKKRALKFGYNTEGTLEVRTLSEIIELVKANESSRKMRNQEEIMAK